MDRLGCRWLRRHRGQRQDPDVHHCHDRLTQIRPLFAPRFNPVIGIKHGKIWKIGKAGNPDIQPAITIPIGAVALLIGLADFHTDLSPRSLLLMTYLAITSICFAIMLWNYGVRHLGATVGSMYSNLSPVFAACIAMALGIYPTVMQIVGGLVILSGVVIAQRWRAWAPAWMNLGLLGDDLGAATVTVQLQPPGAPDYRNNGGPQPLVVSFSAPAAPPLTGASTSSIPFARSVSAAARAAPLRM